MTIVYSREHIGELGVVLQDRDSSMLRSMQNSATVVKKEVKALYYGLLQVTGKVEQQSLPSCQG